MKLTARDKNLIWHPFTQMQLEPEALAIRSGTGAILLDESGKEYIDAIASWWVNLHGHAEPSIAGAIAEQATKLEHVIFAGCTHEPAVEVAEKLLKLLPQNQTRVFYSDNGSTAVEVALKMALQYWHNLGENKYKILVLEGGYHGDTFGAMSLAGKSDFSSPFHRYLFEVVQIATPLVGLEDRAILDLERELETGDTAAFIFEPLCQGVAGMRMYQAGILERLVSTCKAHNVITIADEVMTGFGRTGKTFACEHLTTQPDIFAISKAITGGFLPLGVTTCSERIFQAFLSNDKRNALLHGHSYSGNPIACAAANASMKLFDTMQTVERIQRIQASHKTFLADLSADPRVENCRSIGIIAAFDVKTTGAGDYFDDVRDKLYEFYISRGLLLRPLGRSVYILPPLCISKEQLDQVYMGIFDSLSCVA